jgi:hypothetical protein
MKITGSERDNRPSSSFRLLLTFAMIVIISTSASSQDGAQSAAITQARAMAKRVADSLALNPQIENKLFEENLRINRMKNDAWKLSGSSVIRKELQRIENMRDSIYMTIIPESVFARYKQLKPVLIQK